MAATAADTQHEIGQLRGDMNAVLDEVERRLRGGLRGVASVETRITSRRARDDIVRRARQNPPVLGVVVAAVVSAAGYGGYTLFARLRERRRPQHRLERGLSRFRAGLSAGVHNAPRKAKRVGGVPHNRRKETTMIKKLFWAALTSVLMTLGSVVARRIADGVWRAAIHEAPPDRAESVA